MVKTKYTTPTSLSPRRLRSRKAPHTFSLSHTDAGPSVQVKQEMEVGVKVEHTNAESSAPPEKKKRKYTKRQKVSVKVEDDAGVKDEKVVTQETIVQSKGKGKDTLGERDEVPAGSPIPFEDVEAGPSNVVLLPLYPESHYDDHAAIAATEKGSKAAKGKGKGKDTVKRTKRFRDKAPQTIMQRAERVRTQRMFMLNRHKLGDLEEKFQVLGSTGNVYTIIINSEPSCDCPDFRKGNAPCKHVIFVFLKVLKVPEQSLHWFQRSLLTDELQDIFSAAPLSPHDAVAASANVRKAYLKATGAAGADDEQDAKDTEVNDSFVGKRLDSVGDDCPVCYDTMTEEDEKAKRLIYDDALAGCGKALHKMCFDTWAMTLRAKGEAITCVWCRSTWPVAATVNQASGSGVTMARGGYINMADIAGISRVRDTSTYHFPWRREYQEDW